MSDERIDRHADPFKRPALATTHSGQHCGHKTMTYKQDTDGDGYAGWEELECCWCGAKVGLRMGIMRHEPPEGHGPGAAYEVDIPEVPPLAWLVSP